jgi:hypothetical protein
VLRNVQPDNEHGRIVSDFVTLGSYNMQEDGVLLHVAVLHRLTDGPTRRAAVRISEDGMTPTVLLLTLRLSSPILRVLETAQLL